MPVSVSGVTLKDSTATGGASFADTNGTRSTNVTGWTLNQTPAVTDGTLIAEVAGRAVTGLRAGTDGGGLAEVAVRSADKTRAGSDGALLAELVSSAGIYLRPVTDVLVSPASGASVQVSGVTITDSTATGGASFVDVGGTLGSNVTGWSLLPLVGRTVINLRSGTDGAPLNETAARILSNLRAAADGAALAELVSSAAVYLRSVADVLVAPPSGGSVQVAGVTITDSVATGGALFVDSGGTLGSNVTGWLLAVPANRVVVNLRPGVESFPLSETATRDRIANRPATDSFPLTELASRLLGVDRAAVDVFHAPYRYRSHIHYRSHLVYRWGLIGLQEATGRTLVLFRTAADSHPLSESAMRFLIGPIHVTVAFGQWRTTVALDNRRQVAAALENRRDATVTLH